MMIEFRQNPASRRSRCGMVALLIRSLLAVLPVALPAALPASASSLPPAQAGSAGSTTPAPPASLPPVRLPGQAAPRPAPQQLKALSARIEKLAERILREVKGSGMAIAIVQDDTVLLERGFGVVDTSTGEKVEAGTVFRLASLSKAFAGMLAAMLVDEGALRWDARVVDYLPAFKLRDIQSARNLTVAEILSHRIGLPYNAFDRLLEQDEPYPVLVARLDELESTGCGEGECYGYQNIVFSLIGDIIFASTGDFYSHQVEKRIFHPLGMFTATYGRDGLEESSSWARPHIRGKDRWIPVRPKETYYRVPPAAGVNASVRDLSLWMRAQLGRAPAVLSPELLKTTQTPQVATPGEMEGSLWRRERLRDARYALGWRVYDYAGQRLIYHGGAVQGYRAVLGMLPDSGFGMVILWNSESAVPGGLLPTALDQYLKLPEQDWLQLDAPVSRQAARRLR